MSPATFEDFFRSAKVFEIGKETGQHIFQFSDATINWSHFAELDKMYALSNRYNATKTKANASMQFV